jgi:hypothetical protein
LAGAPFFPRRGGLGPLFVHFALLLKKKRNSRGIFSKKEFPQNLKKVFPPNLTVQQYRPKKYRYRLYLIPGNTDTEKMTGITVVSNSTIFLYLVFF